MARRPFQNPEPPHALRRIREARGFSRAELARRAGFSESHIVKLERGEVRLHVDDLAVFAEALGCEPADLVRRNAMAPAPTVHAPIVDMTELDDIDALVDDGARATVPVAAAVKRAIAVPLLDDALDRVAPLGSFAVFDRDDRMLKDGEIYLVRHEGQWLCRRWRQDASGGRLEPDSRGREHRRIPVFRPPQVLGRLVAVVRKL
jgi:transcriptional regulator with XRE-family HTH domain